MTLTCAALPTRPSRLARLTAPWLLAACAVAAPAGAGDQPVAQIAAAAGAEAMRLAGPSIENVRVEDARVDPRLRLPRCSRPLDARAAPGGRLGARTTVEVSCAAPAWRVFVPVELSARLQVVVAARPLPVRAPVQAADLALADRDSHALTRGYFTRIEDVLGLELSRALGAGEALTPAMLRSGTVVRRGQQVVLLAQGGGITVRMQGEALADGGLSQRIRVRNLSSGREIEGIVRSADLVEVAM